MSISEFVILVSAGLLFSFFFSGTETGVLTADLIDLQQREKQGSRGASRIIAMLRRKDAFLATLLIGNNITNISLSAVATAFFSAHFGPKAPFLTIVVVTPLILLFGEIFPKALYLTHGNQILIATHWLCRFFEVTFKPVTFIAMLLPRVLTSRKNPVQKILTREDIHVLVNTGAVAHEIAKDERIMISRLLEMKDRRVVKAMVPIVDVAMVEDSALVRDAHREIRKRGVSRLPVYHENHDTIVGIVQAVDLLKSNDPREPIKKYLRKPYFVPEQKSIIRLLEETYQEKEMAVVIDEYGIASGIITVEDMVEEILGDILDEYDEEHPISYKLKSGSHVVDSRISIKEFNERIAPLIPIGDYLTLGGFIAAKMQKIPQIGDECEVGDIRFGILEATPQRVGRVIVHLGYQDTKNKDNQRKNAKN